MKKKIYIEGMSCEHCVKRVKKALEAAGAKGLHVSVGLAEGEFKPEISDEDLRNIIEDTGYEVIRIE